MAGALEHPQSRIVARLIIQKGWGAERPAPETPMTEWPVHHGREPNDPDDCITVYATAGKDDGRTSVDGERQEHLGFQVRIRSIVEERGYLKARDLAVKFDQQVLDYTVAIGAARYLVQSIMRTTDVLPLGKEVPASKRSLFTFNGLVTVTQV